jgi:hypothetical protein
MLGRPIYLCQWEERSSLDIHVFIILDHQLDQIVDVNERQRD